MIPKQSWLCVVLLAVTALAERSIYQDDPLYNSTTIELLSIYNITKQTKRHEKRAKTGNKWFDYSEQGENYYNMWKERDQPDTPPPGNIKEAFTVKLEPGRYALRDSHLEQVSETTLELIRHLGKPANLNDYVYYYLKWPPEDSSSSEDDLPDGDSGDDPVSDFTEDLEIDSGDDCSGSDLGSDLGNDPSSHLGDDPSSGQGNDPASGQGNDSDNSQGSDEPKLFAFFQCLVSVKEGVFVVLSFDRRDIVPEEWKFSQIAWWMWTAAVDAEHPASHPRPLDYSGLDYYFQQHVTNTATVDLIEIALRDEEPGPTKEPIGSYWFGPHSPPDQPRILNPYYPLLASPNMAGLIFMLTEHKRAIRGKGVNSITVHWPELEAPKGGGSESGGPKGGGSKDGGSKGGGSKDGGSKGGEPRHRPPGAKSVGGRPVEGPAANMQSIENGVPPPSDPKGNPWTRETYIMWADLRFSEYELKPHDPNWTEQ